MFRVVSRVARCCLLACLWIEVARLPANAQELTPAMQAEFGAANWIPADAAHFAATYRCGERWQAFVETETYQEILTMPAVQMGLAWIQQQGYLEQLAAMRAQNRLLDQAVDVLLDAVSTEMFLYVDRRGPGFIAELGGIYNQLVFAGFLNGINESSGASPVDREAALQEQVIRRVLAAEDALRMPGVVLGFRLSKPEAGRALIDQLTPMLQQLVPQPIVEEELGEGRYLTLSLRAESFLTPDREAEVEAELDLDRLDQETADQFMAFLRSQSLSISLGMRHDYLLISIGADNSHLEELGVVPSLAACEAMAPIRGFFKPGMIGLKYAHPDWAGGGKLDEEGLLEGLQEFLGQFSESLPPGLEDRLMADAEVFIRQLNTALPEAAPSMAASFWNRGVESISYSPLYPGALDTSEPLSILEHAGASPMFVMAGHSPPSVEGYKQLANWCRTSYGYFEDYAVPQIEDKDLVEFRKFESVFLPALARFDATTRELLLPSIDGGQSLLAIDTGGVVHRTARQGPPLPRPIRYPRPAAVVQLNDATQFAQAWHEYRQTFNQMMARLAEVNSDVAAVEIPPPRQRPFRGSTLYDYPLPEEWPIEEMLGADFGPNVALTGNHFAFSLSAVHSAQLLESRQLTPTDVVDLTQPAGRAIWFDFQRFNHLLCDDAEAILAIAQQELDDEFDPALALMIQTHVGKLRRVLGAVRSYRSRTYEEHGLTVTHSWWHYQDIER